MLCSRVVTLRTGLSAARTGFIAARASAVLATSALNTMDTENEQLESQVAKLFFTIVCMRLQLGTAQSPFSFAALASPHGECNWYLGLSRFLAGQLHRLGYIFFNLLTSAWNSRSTLCRGVGSLLDVFGAHLDNENVSEDLHTLPLSECVSVVFNKIRFSFHSVWGRLSFLSFAWLCSSVFIFQPSSCRSSKASHLFPWRLLVSNILCASGAPLSVKFYWSKPSYSTANHSLQLRNFEHPALGFWNKLIQLNNQFPVWRSILFWYHLIFKLWLVFGSKISSSFSPSLVPTFLPASFDYLVLLCYAPLTALRYSWGARSTHWSTFDLWMVVFLTLLCSAVRLSLSLLQLKSAQHWLVGSWLCVAQFVSDHRWFPSLSFWQRYAPFSHALPTVWTVFVLPSFCSVWHFVVRGNCLSRCALVMHWIQKRAMMWLPFTRLIAVALGTSMFASPFIMTTWHFFTSAAPQ